MTTPQNRQFQLAARPVGMVKPTDFRFVTAPAPSPGPGEVLIKVRNFGSVPRAAVLPESCCQIGASVAHNRFPSGLAELPLQFLYFRANNQKMSTVEFSRYDTCEIRTNRRGRGLQHGHIILIEARRWQIYSARAWPEDLSPILHARFLHLSFLSRGLDPSHRAAVARAFHIGKRLGVLCLDPSWKISAPGAQKYFDRVRK